VYFGELPDNDEGEGDEEQEKGEEKGEEADKSKPKKKVQDARQQGVDAVDFFGGAEVEMVEDDPTAEDKQGAEEELAKYLKLPQLSLATDTLAWWKINQDKYPRLARMARQLLAVPATSACCERFFSAAGLAFSDLRQAMSEGHLEAVMWAKFNVVNLKKQLYAAK
jgi:hypothetical protein